jgi:hypothetical protein
MSDTSGTGFGGAANELMKLLRDAAGLYIEPSKIRRNARAKADEMAINTEAEIQRAENLQRARHRLEYLEMRREQNLRRIAELTFEGKPPHGVLTDEDWTVRFIEASKDTSDERIQELWAKLLRGEMEHPGSCSKRTLRLVEGLSHEEALLIQSACRRVCLLETEDAVVPFISVVIRRIEGEDERTIVADIDPETRRTYSRLHDCGFLSGEDFKGRFFGEGHLDHERFALSKASAQSIRIGEKILKASNKQPSLLDRPQLHAVLGIPIRGAEVELDAWRLSLPR